MEKNSIQIEFHTTAKMSTPSKRSASTTPEEGPSKKNKTTATIATLSHPNPTLEIHVVNKQEATQAVKAIVIDDRQPTWKGEGPIIGRCRHRITNEMWMTGYLGLPTKFHLRYVAVSHFVLPYAVEMDKWDFSEAELVEALTKLAEMTTTQGQGGDEEEEDDTSRRLIPLDNFATIKTDYIEPYTVYKPVPADKRVELLARLLLTVGHSLEHLSAMIQIDPPGRQKELCEMTQQVIREKEGIPLCVLSDIDLKYLQAPKLGPLRFGNKEEHAVEKWTRVHSLLRYARFSFTKAHCTSTLFAFMGLFVPPNGAGLSEDKPRDKFEYSAREWLGLGGQGQIVYEVVPAWAVPHWMQPGGPRAGKRNGLKATPPGNMSACMQPKASVDRRRTVIPRRSGRRELQFEVFWLEDIEQALSAKCKEHWSDRQLRGSFNVSDTDEAPDFAEKQMELNLPRPTPGQSSFAQWRDLLRRQLGLSKWRLDFDNLYLINQKIDPCRLDKKLLSAGAEEPKAGGADDDDAPKCIRLISTEYEEPYLSWDKLWNSSRRDTTFRRSLLRADRVQSTEWKPTTPGRWSGHEKRDLRSHPHRRIASA